MSRNSVNAGNTHINKVMYLSASIELRNKEMIE